MPAAEPEREQPTNEAEFLAAEVRAARSALRRIADEVPDTALRAADARAWFERFPLATLAAASAAGFGIAWWLRRRKAEPKGPKPPVAEAVASEPAAAPRHSRSWVKRLMALAGRQLWNFAASQLTEILKAPKPVPPDPHSATGDESADCGPTAR